MYYSNEEFTEIVENKLGVVKQFRDVLRAHELINNREQLSDVHLDWFNKSTVYKHESKCTWVQAFEHTLEKEGLINTTPIDINKELLLKQLVNEQKHANDLKELELAIRMNSKEAFKLFPNNKYIQTLYE